ncbi:MAG TPA: hypothetical protein VN775_04950 [Opitutaceae bacterium]|nr:hypothetical protein [Opitutaceae bacterium]
MAIPVPPNQQTRLLEAVATATIPANPEPFVIRERFEKPEGIKFATVWNEFKRRFYGKTEGPLPETALRKYKLQRIAPDAPIIAELGGEPKVECAAAAAHALLRRQGAGEDGILQTNGYANIFYVRDLKGALCAVRIGWDGEGWVVDAIPVEDPLAWNGKHEIFSPISAG